MAELRRAKMRPQGGLGFFRGRAALATAVLVMFTPDLAILRHVAPGLAHEPHRRAVHRFAPARAEESILHDGGIGYIAD